MEEKDIKRVLRFVISEIHHVPRNRNDKPKFHIGTRISKEDIPIVIILKDRKYIVAGGPKEDYENWEIDAVTSSGNKYAQLTFWEKVDPGSVVKSIANILAGAISVILGALLTYFIK